MSDTLPEGLERTVRECARECLPSPLSPRNEYIGFAEYVIRRSGLVELVEAADALANSDSIIDRDEARIRLRAALARLRGEGAGR